MIVEELNTILNNYTGKKLGYKLNSLYDEFRGGRNPDDLLYLLNSTDKMIGYGCDICCEIKINDKFMQNKIIEKLQQILAKNKDFYNRERAFSALYGFYMDNNDITGFNLICENYKNDSIYDIKYFATNFLKDSGFTL